jgi:hypothetical protein
MTVAVLLAAPSFECGGAEFAARATPDEQRAARAAQQAAWTKAAEARTDFTVRGVGLGMTLPELERKLGAEVVEVRPERKAGWKPPAYSAYEETLRLADGSKLTAGFSSPVNGSLGGVIMYEQTLRDGPTPEKLLSDLTARYGTPDERGASGWWPHPRRGQSRIVSEGPFPHGSRREGRVLQGGPERLQIHDARRAECGRIAALGR